MEEERPLQEARQAMDDQEPATMVTEDEQNGNGNPKSSFSALIIVGVVLVISLLVAGLFLPPISLGERLGLGGDETADVATTTEEETMAEEPVSVAAGDVTLSLQSGEADVSSVTPEEFAADEEMSALAAALPPNTDLSSNVYLMDYGDDVPQGNATVAIPEGATAATTDLFGWNGSRWVFVPATPDETGTQLVSAEGPLPQALAIMQTNAPDTVSVGAEVLPTQSLPPAVLPYLTEVSVGTLTLGENGALGGEVAEMPTGGYQQYVRATNAGVIVDQVSLAALLNDEALIEQHVNALLQNAAGYAGVNLDYQGAPAGMRDAYTTLVTQLADALHGNGQSLIVTLGTPTHTDGGGWDTGSQDWQAIGQIADAVYVRLPVAPAAYGDDSFAQEMAQWATTQIFRHKLSLLASANAVDAIGGSYQELPAAQALANFGELSLTQGTDAIEPGTPIEVGLAGTASPLEWDGDSMMYKYSYQQAGQTHTVWLSNEAAVSQRISMANALNARGVAVRGLGTVGEGTGYAAALESYVNAAAGPEPAGAAIVWTVEDDEGGVVASSSGEALTYRWEDTSEPGRYTINAAFAQGDSVAKLGSLPIDVEEPPEPTPTPQPTADAVAEDDGGEADGDAEAATPAPTAAAPAEANPGSEDAAVNISANMRSGPGLGYAVIEVIPTGAQVSLTGRNGDASWLQVQPVSDPEKEGWIFAQLLTVNDSVDVNALAVIDVAPPTVGGGGEDGGGEPAPPPPAPVANTGFELGGQTHTLANPTLMQQAGMNWVKFQHKWGPGDSPDAVAGRINHAHGNGFKVLLSIPGSNTYPSSIDFNAYVEFLRGVAALGPDAIEIWNEMNIDFEWPAGQIDPNSYVNNMLAPAYNAIKGANPNVMVISGAPAPTGFDNGTNAWADDRYMAGVAAAGGANYMDCIGVHHNAGATPPNASTGHPAGNNHYSWYFLPTLNMYYNTFGGARPVCFTEIGYLSGQDFGGVPSRFSWAANTTVAQHAQWLGEATSLAGNSGKVRLFIVFNVDFTHWGEDPQAGYAILRPDGSCPACATLSAAMGG